MGAEAAERKSWPLDEHEGFHPQPHACPDPASLLLVAQPRCKPRGTTTPGIVHPGHLGFSMPFPSLPQPSPYRADKE